MHQSSPDNGSASATRHPKTQLIQSFRRWLYKTVTKSSAAMSRRLILMHLLCSISTPVRRRLRSQHRHLYEEKMVPSTMLTHVVLRLVHARIDLRRPLHESQCPENPWVRIRTFATVVYYQTETNEPPAGIGQTVTVDSRRRRADMLTESSTKIRCVMRRRVRLVSSGGLGFAKNPIGSVHMRTTILALMRLRLLDSEGTFRCQKAAVSSHPSLRCSHPWFT